jgi:hypothetical protein
MVRIQQGDDNNITSGNIKPINEKFFVTIEEMDDTKKEIACDWGEFGIENNLGGNLTNYCLVIQVKSFS